MTFTMVGGDEVTARPKESVPRAVKACRPTAAPAVAQAYVHVPPAAS